MHPTLRFLDDALIGRILDEARDLLVHVGVEVHNDEAVSLLTSHGASVDDAGRVLIPPAVIDRALKTAPDVVRLFDALGRPTHELTGDNVYFTPGSAAIHVLDEASGKIRPPTTDDYVRFVKVVSGLKHIAAQSTALIPAEVPEGVSDCYRLYLSLLLGEKPVVTGAFSAEGFGVMRDLLLAVRESGDALREKPLALFSCCPTAPLKWSKETSQNVIDCARAGVPVEFISMPLPGFVAPVTLVGSVVQHAAETLSGVALSQLAEAGAPMLWGGSPAIFDIRYETTPMGAIETMMLGCANAEVGKRLGIPTQAYIALSDSKRLDAQAGLETGMGAVLAGLCGINSISGPGMHDFESCLSVEKLVLDDEICAMVARMRRGIEPRDDFPARPLFEELLRDGHLLIADHTRRHMKEQIHLPGPVIERASLGRWREEGESSLGTRAAREVERLVAAWEPSSIPDETKEALRERMGSAAREAGLDALPVVEA